jgi:integrase
VHHERLDEWADWMLATGASAKTVRTRVQGIEGLARHAGVQDPAAVTTRQIVAWLARGELSPWTRLTYWHSVAAWGAWLVARGYRVVDPAAGLPRPRNPQNRPRPVPDHVIDEMLNHPASTRAYAYTVLAVCQGLRVHEIAKFRGEDVQGDWLYVTGKGGQQAAVPVHPRTKRLAAGMRPRGYWFPGAMNGHVRPVSVSLTLSKAIRAAGGNATAHALRHSYGTALLRRTRNLRVTQQMLRHSSVAATERYTLVSARDMVEAIGQLRWGDAA